MQVTISIPDPMAVELNGIAKSNGFSNAKEMIKKYIRFTIVSDRGTKSVGGIREAAEAKAELAVDSIDVT